MGTNNLTKLGITDEFYSHVRGKIKPQTKELRTNHAVQGLLTETGELIDAFKKADNYGKPLDTENVVEEVGDILFYLVMLDIAVPTVIHYYPEIESVGKPSYIRLMGLTVSVCRTATLASHREEGHHLHLITALTRLLKYVNYITGTNLGLTMCQQYNIEKLNKRYPEGFSDEKAELRLDKTILIEDMTDQEFQGLTQECLDNLGDSILREVLTLDMCLDWIDADILIPDDILEALEVQTYNEYSENFSKLVAESIIPEMVELSSK